MGTYIALLRGVNVGGKNSISMPLLKDAFTEAGFSNVRTYINSGNILFSSGETDAALLQRSCGQLVLERFGLDIAVAVLSAEELLDALALAPAWWGADPDSKHNAIFVIAPADAQSIIREVGDSKPEYERVAAAGRIIFWSAPLKTFSKTRWSKVVASSAYGSITIRNANTARKLALLCE